MSLAGSRGGAPWWGLGQRPNCSSSNLLKENSQQRRRQRSVPAPNFALPQERPQLALPTTCILSRQMGATDQHGKYSAFHAGLLYCRENRICGSYHPLFLVTTSTTAAPAKIIGAIRTNPHSAAWSSVQTTFRIMPRKKTACAFADGLAVAANYSASSTVKVGMTPPS